MHDTDSHARRAARALCIGVSLLFFLVSIYVHQRPPECPTPVSRLALLHSLRGGHFDIDAYLERTPDVAKWNGHFYSDKAPGTVVLALPAFTIAAKVLKNL